jgi:lipid A disaccharide synthetase
VKELIQDEMNAENIFIELQRLLSNSNLKENMDDEFKELNLLCGSAGASNRIAAKMVLMLK